MRNSTEAKTQYIQNMRAASANRRGVSNVLGLEQLLARANGGKVADCCTTLTTLREAAK